MERLTRTDISMAINILSHPQSGDESDTRKAVADVIEAMRELQRYKDLEEQGRLIEIIRCKDCLYFDNTDYSDDCGWCDCWGISVIGDEYCDQAKLAELKGGGTDG